MSRLDCSWSHLCCSLSHLGCSLSQLECATRNAFNMIARPQSHFGSSGSIVMAISCECDCDGELGLISLTDHGLADFPLQCRCTLCGPVAADGRRCVVQLSSVVAYCINAQRGRPLPGSAKDCAEAVVFCDRCQDHNLLILRQAAVRRMQAKRKVAQRERRERLRKYLRVLFRPRFHGSDAGGGIAEFLV